MSVLSHTSGCHTPEKAHISMETEEWQLFCILLVEDRGCYLMSEVGGIILLKCFSWKKFHPRGRGCLETGYVLWETERWSQISNFTYLSLFLSHFFFFLSQVTACNSPAQIASTPEEVARYFCVLYILTLQSINLAEQHGGAVGSFAGLQVPGCWYDPELGIFCTLSPCPPFVSLPKKHTGWSETLSCP